MGSGASLKPLTVASVKQLLHDLDKQNAAGTAALRASCCRHARYTGGNTGSVIRKRLIINLLYVL